MSLTAQQFVDFFLAKRNGTYKCPFCGKEDFAINGFNENDVPGLLLIDASREVGAPTIARHPFYSFCCTNCGHADFFHWSQIEKWLKSREEETSKKAETGNG